MLNLTVLTWLRFFVWMVIGVVVYFAYSRRHSLLGKRTAVTAPVRRPEGHLELTFLCLDVGSTWTKGALVAAAGALLGVAQHAHHPAGGARRGRRR